MTQYEPTVHRCPQCGGWKLTKKECVTCQMAKQRQS